MYVSRAGSPVYRTVARAGCLVYRTVPRAGILDYNNVWQPLILYLIGTEIFQFGPWKAEQFTFKDFNLTYKI